jgi:putative tryptophan/tyrosine transport system substrate-binding protein
MHMRRREFITLLGGAVAWPVAARAQRAAMPVIGFLNSTSPGPAAPLVTAFREALGRQGYVEGRNLAIEYRWAEGHYERLPGMAADLVNRNVALIAASGGVVTAKAAMSATSNVPIVFIAGFDPVREGLVTSIARPTGNATGVNVYSAELGKKRLELLREIVAANRIGFLVNPGSISTNIEITDLQENTRDPDLQLVVLEARTDADLDHAFEEAVRRDVGALIVSADSFFTSRRNQIVALAARHNLPASYPWPEYAEAGGFLSYGTTLIWAYDRIGLYASRILKGAKPADLPVQLPTTFEMVINLRTARALGITVSPFVLARADRVIE